MARRKLSMYDNDYYDYVRGDARSRRATAIYGRKGNDTINGLAGDDTIDGGLGNDVLNGGSGRDTFIVSKGYDVIEDFDKKKDFLKISKEVRKGGEFSVTKTDKGVRLNHSEGTVLFEGRNLKYMRDTFKKLNVLPDPPKPEVKIVEKIVEVEKGDKPQPFNPYNTGHQILSSSFGDKIVDIFKEPDDFITDGIVGIFRLGTEVGIENEGLGWTRTPASKPIYSPFINLATPAEFAANKARNLAQYDKAFMSLPKEIRDEFEKDGDPVIDELAKELNELEYSNWEDAVVVNSFSTKAEQTVGTLGDDYYIFNGETFSFKGNPAPFSRPLHSDFSLPGLDYKASYESNDDGTRTIRSSSFRSGDETVVVNTRSGVIDLSDSAGAKIYAMRDGDYTIIAPQDTIYEYVGDDIVIGGGETTRTGSTNKHKGDIIVLGGARSGNWEVVTPDKSVQSRAALVFSLSGEEVDEDYSYNYLMGMKTGTEYQFNGMQPTWTFEPDATTLLVGQEFSSTI